MKPTVRVFTKDDPCTAKDVWGCFRSSASTFSPVQVDVAHSLIGMNVPRGMEQRGRLATVTIKGRECYELTALGRKWAEARIRSYVTNHPAEVVNVKFPPAIHKASATSVRRVVRKRGGSHG